MTEAMTEATTGSATGRLRPARAVLLAVLKAYRLVISPLYGNVCRYHPSCSAYALRAVEVHGAARGSWLAVRRLGRCHPWAAGGYDPVPGTIEARQWAEDQAADRRAEPTTTASTAESAAHIRGSETH